MNLNVGQKLTAGFSILLFLMGIISIASYLSLDGMREATDLVHSRVNASANMNRLRQKMEEALSANAFAIMGDVEEKITFDLKIKSMEDIFKATAQYDLGEKNALLSTVRTQFRDIQKKTDLIYKIAEEEGKGFDNSQVEELLAQIEDIQISMIENMQALVNFLEDWITRAVSQADETKRRGTFVTGGLSIVAIIFSVIAAFLLTENITKPVRSLVAATRQVAEGNLEARIEGLRHDEIGKLNQSFNQMTDNLRHTLVSRDYFDNIIQSMIGTLIVLGSDLKIQRVNQASCRLLGYREDELVGSPIWNVLAKEDVSSKNGDFIDKVGRGKFQNQEVIYITKEGAGIPVLLSASAMFNKSDAFNNIVCVALDITARKRAEEEREKLNKSLEEQTLDLEQRNRELEDFAHISSHDLQEPLRKVVVFGDRLKDKYEDVLEGQGKNYLDRILSSSRRMQTLINDLLAYSLVTKRGQTFVPVDLTKVVRKNISEFREEINQKQGTVQVETLPTLDADPSQMHQLFRHLIGNALKFNKPDAPPVVKISSTRITERRSKSDSPEEIELCQITVEDNGIGFEEKYTDRIFAVFQHLHNRSEFDGNGIGLALCRKIAQQHGGNITAKSRPGEGAAFIVLLPMHQTQEVENT